MSEYNDGWNAALDEVLRVHQEHIDAHREFAERFATSRPDVPKTTEHYIANDLKALAEKVKRLKR